jgi:surface protein
MSLTNEMFVNCPKLKGGNGTAYADEHTDVAYACADGKDSKPGYFTAIGPKVYTLFVDATGTLTYYYDDKWADCKDGIVELYDPENEPNAERLCGYSDKITKAVIDKSMKDAQLTSTKQMFRGGYDYDLSQSCTLSNLAEIKGMENLNTAYVTDMESMFDECKALKYVNLNELNTSNVINMKAMFGMCQSMEYIEMISFNTAKVKDMSWMFDRCTGLKYLDLRKFQIDKLEDTGWMFNGCESLEYIYGNEDWSLSKELRYSTNMFNGCHKLVGGKGTAFNAAHTDFQYARPDGLDGEQGYFTTTLCTISFRCVPEEGGVWYANGDSVTAQQLVVEKESVAFAGVQANEGYEFLYLKQGNTVIEERSIEVNVANNMTVTAYFRKINREEGLESVMSDDVQSTKMLRDGQLFILRGDKVYTLTGQEVK